MTKKDREVLESIQSEISGLKQSLNSLEKSIQNINPPVYKYALFDKSYTEDLIKLIAVFKSSRMFNKGDYHVTSFGVFREIADILYYESSDLFILITQDLRAYGYRSAVIKYVQAHPEEFTDNDKKR